MVKNDYIKPAATSELGLQLTEEEQMRLDVEVAYAQFKANQRHAFFPFWALSRIYSFHVLQDDIPDAIKVPSWIIDVLFSGFSSYRDAIGSNKSFGEAFGLEGGGQGRLPAARQFEISLRNIQVCLSIALAEDQGMKVEAAIQEAADKRELSPTTVRDIWAKNAEHARSCLKNFRESRHS